jgi:hypothetical protein
MSEEDKKEMSEEEKTNAQMNEFMSQIKVVGSDGQSQTMSMQDMLDQKSADQEILTFNFLQEVIIDNVGEDEWQEVTLEQYHENEGQIKATFSMIALNFLTHEKREQLQQQVWSAPYGFFYIWQFAANGLRYYNEAGLSSVLKYLEPLVEDMENNLDYGRFNHFGRILAVTKFYVYSANNKNEKTDAIVDVLSDLMGKTKEHRDNELSQGANGENNQLNGNEVEACEMSIGVIDTLLRDLSLQGGFYYHQTDNSFEKLSKGIQTALKFVEELKSEDWTGERTKLFADIEKDLNDMLEHIQPKEELTTEDVMSQLEALMNQMKEENPEAYAEIEKQAKEITEPTKESEVDLNVNMELSTAMWQAGRYTSFHYWLGDYPEGSPNYNKLHDEMIPKYKATKESFEANATGIITYEDFTKQMNANLDGYALEDGEFSTEEVKAMITDFISGIEEDDSFDLIANYPELIYQCGVVSASFDNGCLTDVPDHIKKHCDRWGWVMTKKIEWFNNIATELIS